MGVGETIRGRSDPGRSSMCKHGMDDSGLAKGPAVNSCEHESSITSRLLPEKSRELRNGCSI